MTRLSRNFWRLSGIGVCALLVSACQFDGLNSLPLPGATGRGPRSTTYHVELLSVGTLVSNSPVMLNDVVVGAVGRMRVRNRHADLDVSVKPDVVVPANAAARIGQTSLLGSTHLALDPPLGQPPVGRLQPGATLPVSRTSMSPSTEQTLSSLSAVVNSGGLGQISEVIHSLSTVLGGREHTVRDLIDRLNAVIAVVDDQRDNVVQSMQELNRLAATIAAEHDTITVALSKIPRALDVLIRERPHIMDALNALHGFATTTTGMINDFGDNLVTDLHNLQPTLRALADVGPDIDSALGFATTFPLGQNIIDRGVRGDYMNLFVVADITANRNKRGLLLGTRWGHEGLGLVPAPGDPGYDAYYTRHPLTTGITPPPADDPPVGVPSSPSSEPAAPAGPPAPSSPRAGGR